MAKRWRATHDFDYPDKASMAMVRRCGRSKLTPEQAGTMKLVQVKPGDFCDDLPPVVRRAVLRRDPPWIEEVEVAARPAAKAKAKPSAKKTTKTEGGN